MKRSSVLLLCLVLHTRASWGSPNASPVYSDGFPYNEAESQCRIKPSFHSPYVTSINEHSVPAFGCVSREVNKVTQGPRVVDQEVHVVRVNNGGGMGAPIASASPADKNGPKQQRVTLHIKPIVSGMTYDDPLVFVLSSPKPIIWKVKAERIGTINKMLFLVSSNVKLLRDRRVRMSVKSNAGMPQDGSDDALVKWARQKFKVVTSFVKVQQADSIYLNVGQAVDKNAPPTCALTNKLAPLAEVVAKYGQLQPSAGCVATRQNRIDDSDVHVIEVTSAGSNLQPPNGGVLVLIDILIAPQLVKTTLAKNLVLVLQCHQRGVKWRLHSRGIKGTMKIITDDEVDTNGVEVHTINVVAEEFSDYSGSALINWVTDIYGPPLSYIKTDLANRFYLTVDQISAEGNGLEGGKQRAGNGVKVSPFNQPRITEQLLTVARDVTCYSRHIVVTLRKDALMIHGIRSEYLSFLDETCTAAENGTHFILSTMLENCGTTMSQLGTDSNIYSNSVVLRRPLVDKYLALDLVQGSGSYLDDEDRQPVDEIRSEFRCADKRRNQNDVTFQVEDSGVRYHMRIFEDPIDPQTVDTFPLTVRVQQRIFVEATLQDPGHSGMSRAVVVESCWLSRNKDDPMSDPQKYPLIIAGCKEDSSVNYTAVETGQLFSFQFNQNAHVGSILYLACYLTACKHQQNCISKDDNCMLQSVGGDYGEVLKTLGPFIVQSGNSISAPNILGGKSVSEVRSECGSGQVKQVAGLSSHVVVGIAFSAFAIGALLMAALWYIKVNTGKRDRAINKGAPCKLLSGSGQSTPNSTVPFGVQHVSHA